MRLLRAQYVATMAGPVLRDAGVAIAGGRIVDVGAWREVAAAHGGGDVQDLGRSVLLPGLVNAHCHLELSDKACGEAPAGGFVGWLASRREPRTPESIAAAISVGVSQCIGSGVTSVGDITKFSEHTRPLLRGGPLRVVSFGEAIGLALARPRFEPALARALDASCASDRLRIGLSPHAPYTVDAAAYRRCVALAHKHNLPLATHLAESEHEAEFLRDHAGPFRDLWEKIGAWEDYEERFAGGPIRYAQSLGLLDYPTVLAHVNYCDDEELGILAAGRASVVWCPRTHAYFGHPPHRWRDMLAAGVNVAIGTDSCASSPDLNLVDDLRLAHKLAPEVACEELWRMVTIGGARALGMDGEVGTLAPGKHADVVAFPASDADPLRAILQTDARPIGVWIGGEPLKGRAE